MVLFQRKKKYSRISYEVNYVRCRKDCCSFKWSKLKIWLSQRHRKNCISNCQLLRWYLGIIGKKARFLSKRLTHNRIPLRYRIMSLLPLFNHFPLPWVLHVERWWVRWGYRHHFHRTSTTLRWFGIYSDIL